MNSALSALVAMAAGMGAAIGSAVPMSGWRPGRHAKARPVINPAATKFGNARGRIGLRHPTLGLTPTETKISPKKDIGKGPAHTMPVRGYTTPRQQRKATKAMRRDLKAMGV